jgi:hypothetical protein
LEVKQGSLTALSGNLANISANTLVLKASGALGGESADIRTDVDTLTATASQGGVYITETDDLALLSVSTAGNVTLTARTGAITAATGHTGISAVNLTLSAATGVMGLETKVTSLTVTTSSGDVSLDEDDALIINSVVARGTTSKVTLTVDGDVVAGSGTEANGFVNVLANSLVLSSTGAVGTAGALRTDVNNLTVSSSATAGSGDLVISNAGNVAVVSVSTASDVSLSSTGEITAATDHTGISAVNLTLSAATGVTGLETQVTSLTVTTTSGDVSLSEADALTINRVDAQDAASTVTLTVGGDVVAGSGSAANILANSLVLSSTGAVGAAGALRTDVNNLTMSSSAAAGLGNLVISNADDLAVVSVSTLSDVTLTSTGAISDAASDTVLDISAVNLTLSAATGVMGLETQVTSLTVTTTNGNVSLSEADALIINSVDAQGATSTVTLTVGGDVVAGSGSAANVLANSLVLSSTGAVGTAGALRTDVNNLTMSSSATAGLGNLVISNAGNLAVVSVSTLSDVSLSSTGAITAATGHTGISAANLTLSAATGVTGLETQVTSLTVTTINGDVSLSEADALTINSVDAQSATSTVTLTVGGDVVAGSGSAANVLANSLVLSSTGAVGAAGDALRLEVDELRLSVSEGGAYVSNAGDLIVYSAQTTDTLSVALTGETSALTVSGTITVSAGDVKLLTPTGVRFSDGGGVNRGAGSEQPATMTLASSVPTKAIVIADDLSGTPGAWTMSTAELAKLGQSFETVVVGGANYKGDISMSGASMVFADPVEIQTSGTVRLSGHLSAQTLTVNASSQVQIAGDMVLSVSGLMLGSGVIIGGINNSASLTIKGLSTDGVSQAIVLGGQDTSGTALVLGSNLTNALGASLTQVKVGTGEQSVSVTGDIAFAQSVALNAQRLDMAGDATLTAAGNVVLSSEAGMSLGGISAQGHTVTIADSGAQVSSAGTGVNVTAGSVVFSGWGPASGSSGAPIQVSAASVQVYAPSGMVLRDSGTDGKVTYLVVNGDQVQKQLVSVLDNVSVRAQTVASTTQAPQAPTTLTLSTSYSPTRAGSAESSSVSLVMRSSGSSSASYLQSDSSRLAEVDWRVQAAVDSLANADVTWDIAPVTDEQTVRALSDGFVLGQASTQPLGAGLGGSTQGAFDYWTDTLVL